MRGARAAAAGRVRRAAVDRGLGRRRSSTTTTRACSARSWMAFGLLLYVGYRSREGLSLTRLVEVPAERMSHEPEVEYARILVPVFGEELDDDIMSTAGQLASDRDGERRRDDRRDLRDRGPDVAAARRPAAARSGSRAPRRRCARAKQVGEEYEGVRGAHVDQVRGRTVGSAIVEAARDRDVEVIVIGAEPPSRIKGGGVLGRHRRRPPAGARGGDGLCAGEVARAGPRHRAAGRRRRGRGRCRTESSI